MHQPAVRNVLAVGPTVPSILLEQQGVKVIHCPLIRLQGVVYDSNAFADAAQADAIIFSSKHAVAFWYELVRVDMPKLTHWFCVGPATAMAVRQKWPNSSIFTPRLNTQEGLGELVCSHRPRCVVWPRSTQARAQLAQILLKEGIKLIDLPLYEPVLVDQSVCLDDVDEIFFSCPSSVRAFFKKVPLLPPNVRCTAIGSVTARELDLFLKT